MFNRGARDYKLSPITHSSVHTYLCSRIFPRCCRKTIRDCWSPRGGLPPRGPGMALYPSWGLPQLLEGLYCCSICSLRARCFDSPRYRKRFRKTDQKPGAKPRSFRRCHTRRKHGRNPSGKQPSCFSRTCPPKSPGWADSLGAPCLLARSSVADWPGGATCWQGQWHSLWKLPLGRTEPGAD